MVTNPVRSSLMVTNPIRSSLSVRCVLYEKRKEKKKNKVDF